MRPLIAAVKIVSFLILCFLTIILQAFSAILLKNSKSSYVIQTYFYRLTCAIFRIKIDVAGALETDKHVVYVGNHLSYIDIPAIGATLPATFISKAEVKSWPVLGLLATLSRTIFIERSKSAAEKCIQDIKKSLARGRSLILFPEGTSTVGTSVLPFKSSIFEIFLNEELKNNLIVQPFTVTLTHVDNHPVNALIDQDLYAWYADMTLVPHLWDLGKSKGMRVLLTFHAPRSADSYSDRKLFAKDCEADVALGLKNTLPSALDFTAKKP